MYVPLKLDIHICRITHLISLALAGTDAVLPSLSRGCSHAGLNRRLGLDDKLFVLVDSVLVEALVRIAMMPVLLLAARICPEVRALETLKP